MADAEDAVQESCMRAWKSFPGLRDEARVRPWLYRILRSALTDLHDERGRRDRLAPLSQWSIAWESMASEDAGPFERMVAATSSEYLQDALRQIPEEFALAVELHDLEGFQYREIAEITAVPIGTVMSRIYRGRKMLAALIMTKAVGAELRERESASRQPIQSHA